MARRAGWPSEREGARRSAACPWRVRSGRALGAIDRARFAPPSFQKRAGDRDPDPGVRNGLGWQAQGDGLVRAPGAGVERARSQRRGWREAGRPGAERPGLHPEPASERASLGPGSRRLPAFPSARAGWAPCSPGPGSSRPPVLPPGDSGEGSAAAPPTPLYTSRPSPGRPWRERRLRGPALTLGGRL
ncbi:hypothetical protein NN561_010087 [Cricetulus griseus]